MDEGSEVVNWSLTMSTKSDAVENEAAGEPGLASSDPDGEVAGTRNASKGCAPTVQASGGAPRVVDSSKKQRKRLIALFGSSLNPVTRGHVALVDALLAEKRSWHLDENLSETDSPVLDADGCDEVDDPDKPLFDEVWVGPVYSHPDVEKYRHLEHVHDRTEEQQAQYVTFLKKQALKDSFDERVSLCRVRSMWCCSFHLRSVFAVELINLVSLNRICS